MRETESVHKLYSIVNKNYLQHIGCVSSRQRRKVVWKNSLSSCTFLDFHQMSESEAPSEAGGCCLQRRLMFWKRSKHSSAWLGCLPAPVHWQILTHQPHRSPFSWRVSWKTWSDCSHFQEALLNLVNPRNLGVRRRGLLDFLGGWAGARRAASWWRHAFRVWVGEF